MTVSQILINSENNVFTLRHRKAYSKVVARSVQMCSQIDMWRHGKEKKGAWGTGGRERERETQRKRFCG